MKTRLALKSPTAPLAWRDARHLLILAILCLPVIGQASGTSGKVSLLFLFVVAAIDAIIGERPSAARPHDWPAVRHAWFSGFLYAYAVLHVVLIAWGLGLMAAKRRLFVLPQLVTVLRAMISTEKGEVTAEVTSAKALTKTQSDKLAKTLSAQAGKSVQIKASVDESLIGGLVVKIGSKMIDTSIRAKLMALQNMMKEVG